MVEHVEFCDKFCEIERKYKLFDIEFNGVKYWKYARYYIYNVIWHNLYGIIFPFWFDDKSEWKCSRYIHRYQKLTDILFHNINLSFKKDVLLFTFNRRIKSGKQYISPVTDEISMQLKRSHCIVESPYCGGYYRPTPIRGIKYFDVWDGVGDKSKEYKPINRGQLRKQLLSIFETEFNLKFTSEEKRILLTNINYYIMYRNDLMTKYRRIIKKVAPKMVLYTAAYIGDMVVLTEVLKELDIPSVEILHGFVAENNMAYTYAEIGLNDALPDYIFAYNQIQKDSIKWGLPKECVKVVGNPWLEKRKKNFISESNIQREKKQIVFISGAIPAIEKYIAYMAEKIDKDKYDIIFKLHPVEYGCWNNIYKKLPNSVEVVDNNENDIHYYLARADFVIGITSTALFEAAIYSAKIIVLEENSWQSMEILLKAGRASLVSNAQELFLSVTDDKCQDSQNNISFYAENAIENINNEIEKIITEREKGC